MSEVVHKIQLFTDFICPFCYVGQGIMESLKKEYKIEDHTMYVEIHTETKESNPPLLKERFPRVNIDALYSNLNKSGAPYGKRFVTPKIMSNSRRASIISEIVREEKGQETLEKYAQHTFRAYFEENKDIGKDEVLSDICKQIGMDWDDVKSKIEKISKKHEENMEAKDEADINGVPHFIIDDEIHISGAQSLDSFRKALNKKK